MAPEGPAGLAGCIVRQGFGWVSLAGVRLVTARRPCYNTTKREAFCGIWHRRRLPRRGEAVVPGKW